MIGKSLSLVRQKFWWLPFGQVAEVSALELHERIANAPPPQILDVRTRVEWKRSHIPGSIHVPITALRKRLPTLDLDPKRPVVAICLSAHRSIPAVRLLQAQGFTDVSQLAGGMNAWWRLALPTTSDNPAV